MPKRVLIIEDETILARNLAATLHRLNIDATLASSYAEGVSHLNRGGFDLVCADLNLGDGNGFDLIDEMSHSIVGLPVMIMTGQDSDLHRARAEQARIPAFLTKPFALSQFRELVASSLEQSTGRFSDADCAPCGPRVMMYSDDEKGSAHIACNVAIATELVASVPDISVLLVAAYNGQDAFCLPPGIDLLKLPTVTKAVHSQEQPGSLRINAQEVLKLRSSLIAQTVKQFAPDVLVVDHEPNGTRDELLPVFKQISESAQRPKLVLGFRDNLEAPDVIRTHRYKSCGAQLLRNRYDRVLIYGEERLVPAVDEYGFGQMPGIQTRYCGYLAPTAPTASKTRADEQSIAAQIAVAVIAELIDEQAKQSC